MTRIPSGFEVHRSSARPKPLEPPVTKATLSELDVTKIIHNPKLRHDINFDPELHFRPNTDGEKGRRKQEKADLFWEALSEQLKMFVENRDAFMRKYGQGEEWCLPLLLKSVKEIIQTLVPSKDRAYLEEGLNVDLIMQQFARGLADLEKLAFWLSGVLKSHCAPMRDEWVDEMYAHLTNGNRNNDVELLVTGMRSLLSVLEAMKLDVANHQIRCLRPLLIDDTVHFEQRFFMKKMRDHKLDPRPARAWYLEMVSRYGASTAASGQAYGGMGVFMEAISRMVLPSYPHPFPETLIFDEERLLKLRSDMLDAINLEICMRVYEGYELSVFDKSAVSEESSDVGSSSDDDVNDFYSSARSRPSSLVFSSAGSACSSPRCSLVMNSFTRTSPSSCSGGRNRKNARVLYKSLLSLVQSHGNSACSPQQRWREIRDSLAIELYRFAGEEAQSLRYFEDRLAKTVSETQTRLFREVEAQFHQRLLAELQSRVREYKGLTSVGLFTAATGGLLQGPGRTWDRDNYPELDGERSSSSSSSGSTRSASRSAMEGGVGDMATRLAHLTTLHWRVWAQDVYLFDFDAARPRDDVVIIEAPARI